MRDLIKELWIGGLIPAERSGVGDQRIKELIRFIEAQQTALEEKMELQHRGLLMLYRERFDEYVCQCSEEAFCDGFSLGLRLAAEAFTGER